MSNYLSYPTVLRVNYFWVTLWCWLYCQVANQSLGQDLTQSPEKLDRVELRQGIASGTKIDLWNPLQVIQLEGRIQSFNAIKLVLAVSSEDGTVQSKTINSDQVQRVFPAWQGAGTAEAVLLFEQRKYADFAQALRELGQTAIPDWQQVMISSMVVQAHEAHGQLNAAGETFIELSKHSLPELVYGDMPLCWSVAAVDISPVARKWIDQDQESARLLGASWLLLGADSSEANSVLAELQKSQTPAIAQLAKAQAWRLTPVPQTIDRLPSWMRERDRMLRPLALGPTEFLSDRLMRMGQYDLAVGQALQIATIYADRFPRAKRSLASAVEMLKKQGRAADADKVSAWIKQLAGAN